MKSNVLWLLWIQLVRGAESKINLKAMASFKGSFISAFSSFSSFHSKRDTQKKEQIRTSFKLQMGCVSVQNFCIIHVKIQYMISKCNYIFIRCFCWHESCGEFTELWSGPDTRIQIFRRLHYLSLGRKVMPFSLKNSSVSCGVQSKFC